MVIRIDDNEFIQKNEFVSTKKYVVRWCLGYALPINILKSIKI